MQGSNLGRGVARTAAAAAVLLLGTGLGGLLGGCSAHQEPASPGERPAWATSPTRTVPVAPLPLPQPQAPGAAPTVRPGPGLDAQDRAQLADARRLGAQWVVLLVQTQPGRTDQARSALTTLGGAVGTTSPGPDTLRVTMPPEKVEQAATAPGVAALDVTEVIPPNHPRTNTTPGNR